MCYKRDRETLNTLKGPIGKMVPGLYSDRSDITIVWRDKTSIDKEIDGTVL
jgi:hypothetical protein